MRATSRGIALALTAVAVAAPAAVTDAKSKKPKPPTTATIKKLLTKTYCAPTTSPSTGQPIQSVKVTFKSIKRGKRRVGSAVLDGTPAGRKTYVFPIRASYFCDFKYTNNATPDYKASDKRIRGDYSFFRDEFGTWVQKNHGHQVETVPGND
jgi:hypothetical protein